MAPVLDRILAVYPIATPIDLVSIDLYGIYS
jgi:hypothetical protein